MEQDEATKERLARALRDLNRVKPGDSLTHFDDDGPTLGELFELAKQSVVGSLVGFELHVATDDGVVHKVLVGHFEEQGIRRIVGDMAPWDASMAVRAARKVWFP